MKREDYLKFKRDGGINSIGRPAMDLLDEIVRLAEENDYPGSIQVSAAQIKLICNFSDTEYSRARQKLIELNIIEGYENAGKSPIGVFYLNYDYTLNYTTGMRL